MKLRLFARRKKVTPLKKKKLPPKSDFPLVLLGPGGCFVKPVWPRDC